MSFHEVALDTTFELVNGVEAELFAVPGKVPLFMEDRDVITDLEGEQTVGVRLKTVRNQAWYIPGCAKLTDNLKSRLQDEALVFFDGTVFENDEMQRAKVGVKTGTRMGHIAMSGEHGSIIEFSELNVQRKIYVHINNTNPVWNTSSEEHKIVKDAGWEIAFDGMEISQ